MKERGLEYCFHDKVDAKDLCPVPHTKDVGKEGEKEKEEKASK